MQRFRMTTILGTMALVLSGCLSPAPSDSAQRGTRNEIDEAQRTASLDETDSTASASFAVEVADPAYVPREIEPCPCINPVCRPGCTLGVTVAFCTNPDCASGTPPGEAPCTSPDCVGGTPPVVGPARCTTPQCTEGPPAGAAPAQCTTPDCIRGVPPTAAPPSATASAPFAVEVAD